MKKRKKTKKKKKTQSRKKRSVKVVSAITISDIVTIILRRSRKPGKYQTKAKNIVTKSIGSRILKESEIRGRLKKKRINRAIVKTFSRNYKRLIKKK
ncbi:hypothetical protein ES705_15051 [subsurface metagenome]